ncbi:MAG: DinB family protein [Ignavibacteriaceae bacterium]|nr:DinB family protein [Ignavibacteriaceae bacterium]
MERTAYHIEKINNNTKLFLEKFGNLSDEQLNFKPNDSTWSIAQNINHLIIVNNSYFEPIESLIAGTYTVPLLAKFETFSNIFGKIILKGVKPEGINKMKTFPVWNPTQSNLSKTILPDFEKSQDHLKAAILKGDDLIANKAVICSPANKKIFYKLDTALEIIATHQLRHFNQAVSVAEKIR